jgi:hypothetical protein
VDRRRTALVLLLLFIVCVGVATVLSGSRPGLQQGIAPTVAAVVGYLFAFVAAVLLMVPAAESQGRTLGVVILGALVVLVLVDLFVAHGPDIGAGFVQLIGEVVILVAAVRLAVEVAADRRAR